MDAPRNVVLPAFRRSRDRPVRGHPPIGIVPMGITCGAAQHQKWRVVQARRPTPPTTRRPDRHRFMRQRARRQQDPPLSLRHRGVRGNDEHVGSPAVRSDDPFQRPARPVGRPCAQWVVGSSPSVSVTGFACALHIRCTPTPVVSTGVDGLSVTTPRRRSGLGADPSDPRGCTRRLRGPTSSPHSALPPLHAGPCRTGEAPPVVICRTL